MDTGPHTLEALFRQLGLPDDPEGMQAFICEHRPLDETMALEEAPWWNPAQREFIVRAKSEDSVWAIAVDELDTLLRKPSGQGSQNG